MILKSMRFDGGKGDVFPFGGFLIWIFLQWKEAVKIGVFNSIVPNA